MKDFEFEHFLVGNENIQSRIKPVKSRISKAKQIEVELGETWIG